MCKSVCVNASVWQNVCVCVHVCVCVKDLNRCKASTWFAAKLSNSSTRPSPEFSLRLFLSGHWFHQLISFYRRGWMHGLAVIHQRRHCLSMVIWRRDAFVTYLPTIFICHSNRLSSEPGWRTTWMISLTARFSQSDDFEHFSLFQNAELWVDNFDLVLVLPFVFSYMGFLMNTS